ncbi:hypothetical protein ASPFODRAFT_41185 [Aspergillus luchuensis CBS 106.47]|uniref:Uncharacterized protein n=1 Tax=Aspergillus luchuensis (strain CBS 106.47) TaxID=1137211 RepID=A0A1M3TVW5_ASPLC|nr:hypothetical protein ASPFODRAFT_41185 [Aspergillus luchuensis CBS 106.47]
MQLPRNSISTRQKDKHHPNPNLNIPQHTHNRLSKEKQVDIKTKKENRSDKKNLPKNPIPVHPASSSPLSTPHQKKTQPTFKPTKQSPEHHSPCHGTLQSTTQHSNKRTRAQARPDRGSEWAENGFFVPGRFPPGL